MDGNLNKFKFQVSWNFIAGGKVQKAYCSHYVLCAVVGDTQEVLFINKAMD